jgi:hypothetical protein
MKWLGGTPIPLSWKATKLTTYPSGGIDSRWLDGGTLYSGWVWLILGRKSPPWTNSSSFLSITEECAHVSTRRIWLLPAMVVGKQCVAAADEGATAVVDDG